MVLGAHRWLKLRFGGIVWAIKPAVRFRAPVSGKMDAYKESISILSPPLIQLAMSTV